MGKNCAWWYALVIPAVDKEQPILEEKGEDAEGEETLILYYLLKIYSN
jgi:hypothetical protein